MNFNMESTTFHRLIDERKIAESEMYTVSDEVQNIEDYEIASL